MYCLTACLLLAAGPASAQSGYYTLNGGSSTQSGQTYAATAADQSAIYVLNSGNLTLTNPTVTKTGDSSSVNTSSQYGLNAGILAASAGVVSIAGGSITTNASGSNGLFATGSGSAVSMTNGSIVTTATGSHGVDVTYGGAITLNNVTVRTSGDSASAGLSTDYGGGTVTATGGSVTTAGSRSPAVYSTGTISVTGATMTATGGPGGVIDGANTINWTNCTLTAKTPLVKVFRSAPGSGTATVNINGGAYSITDGDAFWVTTSSGAATAALTVKGGASILSSTGNLVNADTGSAVTLTLDGETLSGNLIADATSTVTATLKNSTTLTGSVTNAALTLEATSVWSVTADSTVTTIADSAAVSGSSITNIRGNGHLVYYNKNLSGNSYLGGGTFALVNGGYLLPTGSVVVATVSIATASPLPSGTAGLAYSATLAASGGTAPYAWTATSGALPTGLTLTSAGVISGTPTAAGTYSFTVRVSDSASATASQAFALTIAASAICTYSLSPGGQAFGASGGSGAIAVTSGTGCAWTAAGAPSWVSITAGASGSGGGSVSYSVQANTGAARSGAITVDGVAFAVEQSAASVSGYAVAGVMPQIASGAGWDTTITLINSGASPAQLRLNFTDETGAAMQLPLTIPQSQSAGPLMASSLDRTLAGGAALQINAAASQPPQAGWAQLLTNGAVSGFAVFRWTGGGNPEEAVVPLISANPAGWVLWFDNTAGYATGVALVNLGAATSVPVVLRSDDGGILYAGAFSLVAGEHKQFVVADQYVAAKGIRGTLEFQTPAGGQIAVLGVHQSSTGAVTSVPGLAK
jgi:hypothetical protein